MKPIENICNNFEPQPRNQFRCNNCSTRKVDHFLKSGNQQLANEIPTLTLNSIENDLNDPANSVFNYNSKRNIFQIDDGVPIEMNPIKIPIKNKNNYYNNSNSNEASSPTSPTSPTSPISLSSSNDFHLPDRAGILSPFQQIFVIF